MHLLIVNIDCESGSMVVFFLCAAYALGFYVFTDINMIYVVVLEKRAHQFLIEFAILEIFPY